MPKAAKRNSDHAQRYNTPTINNQAIAKVFGLLKVAGNGQGKILTSVD